MLEGAKSTGAGAATIALAGAAVGIGNVFSSLINSVARNPFRSAKSILSETIIWLCHLGICSFRFYHLLCTGTGNGENKFSISDLFHLKVFTETELKVFIYLFFFLFISLFFYFLFTLRNSLFLLFDQYT